MSNITLCLCLATLQLDQPATAPQELPPSHSASEAASFEQTLQRIEERAGEIRDLSAKFTQIKHTALLKKPLQSEGTMRIKSAEGKALMRWDTTKPHPSTMLTTESELRMFYPRQALLEIYPLESDLAKLAASPLPQLDFARRFFRIEECQWEGLGQDDRRDHIGLRLTPIEENLGEHVLEVRLLINTQTSFIISAQIEYPDDERLLLAFEDIRINAGLSDREFELNVGAEVKVVRPLDGRGKAER